MNTLTNPKIEKTEQMKEFLAKKCKGLEAKITQFEKDLNAPAGEEEDEIYQYKIATLLPDIIEEWNELPFERRIATVNAFVRSVMLEEVSPSWITMTIQWKRADWEAEYRYILRENTAKQFWTEEEDTLLWEMYPKIDTLTILKQFPTRNYDMLTARANRLGITRLIKNKGGIIQRYESFSVADWEYMEAQSLTMDNCATWL